MFCFCFQSSLLKLQALEVDMCSPLGPSPEEEPSLPPSLGGEEGSPAGTRRALLLLPASFSPLFPSLSRSPSLQRGVVAREARALVYRTACAMWVIC